MTRTINLNGAIISTDDVSIYEIYTLEIDKEEKTIECWDFANNLIALIHYDFSSGPIEYDDYDEDGNINPYSGTIVNSNGKLVI